MNSVCVSSCVEDARVPTRVRATYTNLYKWPESDAEFVRSVSFKGPGHPRPRVVESISCRQLYLRSYTFTRKESVNEKTKKCFGRVKERVVKRRKTKTKEVKEVSCAAIKAFFRKLLLCSASVDVMDASDSLVR
ncbi:hypothetical protein vseg_013597 [Gypsophila vaccaria]